MPKSLRTDEDCSGKFGVRLPKKLHADLANEATEQGVSLNSYIIYLLSTRYGYILGLREAEENQTQRQNEKLLEQHNSVSSMTVGDADEKNISIKATTSNSEFY